MNTTKRMGGLGLMVLVAGALVAGSVVAGDPVPVLSGPATLDTRSASRPASRVEVGLDSRSCSVEWSDEHKLNTRKIAGTLLLMW